MVITNSTSMQYVTCSNKILKRNITFKFSPKVLVSYFFYGMIVVVVVAVVLVWERLLTVMRLQKL